MQSSPSVDGDSARPQPDRLAATQAIGPWVFAGAAALLLGTLAPEAPLGAGAEAAASAFTLGAAQGPSRVLAALLGWMACLLPLGEGSTRMAILSALSVAAAAGLLYRFASRLSASALGEAPRSVAALSGVVAAAWFVGAPVVLRTGRAASAVGPELVLTALAFALVVALPAGRHPAYAQPATARVGLTLALVAGLALGLDGSVARWLFVPVIVLSVLRLRRGDRWPLLAPFAFALGAAVVFGVPAVRAGISGGRPLAALWDWQADDWGAVGLSHARALAAWLGAMERQLGLPALLLSLLGAGVAARRRPGAVLFALTVAVGDGLWTARRDPAALGEGQGGTFAILALAGLAGVGIAAFAQLSLGGREHVGRSDERPPPQAWKSAAALARGLALSTIALVPPLVGDGVSRLARRPEAGAWARAALEGAPPRALILTATRALDANLAYEQAVAGRRPDVTVLPRRRLWDAERVVASARRGGDAALTREQALGWYARMPRSRRVEQRHLLERLLARTAGSRAVLWEPAEDAPPSGTLVADLPLFHLEPSAVVATPSAALPAAREMLGRLDALLGNPPDPALRRLRARALSALGGSYLDAGNAPLAAMLAEAALRLAPDEVAPALVLAQATERRDDLSGALRVIEAILAAHPDDARALLLGADLRLRLSDVAGAESLLQHVRKLDPRSPAPLVGLARAAHARGDEVAARALADQALERDPDFPEARALARRLGLR